MLLIAYTPPGTRGAYAERGPVFIHAEPCAGYLTPSRYPPGLSHRLQVVRAYDRDGRIASGVMVNDGAHAMTVIRELLTRPDVSLVHLRNVGYGCYNFAVRRVLHTSNEGGRALLQRPNTPKPLLKTPLTGLPSSA